MSLRSPFKNRVACSSIRRSSASGISPCNSSQMANALLMSEWLRSVLTCSAVKEPFAMRASIKRLITTAKPSSGPFTSGSLVGNSSRCFGNSATLDKVLAHKELSASVTELIFGRSIQTEKRSVRVDVSVLLQPFQCVSDALRMQSHNSVQVLSRCRASLAKTHQNLFFILIYYVFEPRLLIQLRSYQILGFVKLQVVSGLVTHDETLITLHAPKCPRAGVVAPILTVIAE